MMNHDEELFKKEKFSVVKKCPKCGSLSLVYEEGKIKCSKCGFEQGLPRIKGWENEL